MRINNQTHWRTDHLRAFISRVAQDELDPAQRKRLRVTIRYNRQKNRGWCSGRASYRHPVMTIMVPSQCVDRVDLANVTAHEMAHTRGMRHAQMRGSPRYRRVGNWRESCAWADQLPLERQAIKPRPTLDERRLQRLAHAQRQLVTWESCGKRVAGRIKFWRSRVKAVERTLQQAAVQPPQEG